MTQRHFFRCRHGHRAGSPNHLRLSSHLGGDHSKTAASFAGAHRFNGGVQRQQIGLSGDGVDQFECRTDPVCC
jgi:hypothetical protein